jgi:hypothetical protein
MASSIFEYYPDIEKLMSWYRTQEKKLNIADTNLHIHTPYSFSAFDNISQAIRLAHEQGVIVLGISDFNTTKGYDEFTKECKNTKIFPAYGMETIALSTEDQKSGIRWNDPSNPGRIYFCGKAFRYPLQINDNTKNTLSRIAEALETQVQKMIIKLNEHLKKVLPEIQLDYNYIRDTLTTGTVRERHLAKALQLAIVQKFSDTNDISKALAKIYGKESQVDITNSVKLQDELRSNLLKAGKVAFVEESPSAYLSMDEAKSVMLDMGGIPCYPVLADGTKGELTEAEKDPEALCNMLISKGIYCAEFIPTRNDFETFKKYISVFKSKDIAITVGTEHNTPLMEPMSPKCKGGIDFGDLKKIFWKGACLISAHQYLTSKGLAGFVDSLGNRTDMAKERLESIGEAVIAYYLSID